MGVHRAGSTREGASFSATPAGAYDDGVYTAVAEQTDVAGNTVLTSDGKPSFLTRRLTR